MISFVYVGIYWNNHHHLMHTVKKVDGWVLWANLHLLFWLSLIPVTTGWIGETEAATWPTVFYGVMLFMSGISWLLLQRAILHASPENKALAKAIGEDWKGKLSGAGYALAIGTAFVQPLISIALYVAIAMVWFIPDRRIETTLEHDE